MWRGREHSGTESRSHARSVTDADADADSDSDANPESIVAPSARGGVDR